MPPPSPPPPPPPPPLPLPPPSTSLSVEKLKKSQQRKRLHSAILDAEETKPPIFSCDGNHQHHQQHFQTHQQQGKRGHAQWHLFTSVSLSHLFFFLHCVSVSSHMYRISLPSLAECIQILFHLIDQTHHLNRYKIQKIWLDQNHID